MESVNRGTNMIVSGASSFDFDVKTKVTSGVVSNIKAKALEKLINYEPNPFQTMKSFRNNIFTDLVLEGNAFVYFDGKFLYNLPASKVEIIPDEKTFIKGFRYMDVTYNTEEVFYCSDVNMLSIYRAQSRLNSALRSIKIMSKMYQVQDSFFENGAIPGLILETDNTLAQSAKDRTIEYWKKTFNIKSNNRTPVIVDNGLKLKEMYKISFQEMDFDTSIARHDKKIMSALGVPPILLDGGNNANISPNLRLFYLETIMPLVNTYTSSLERFFGYDISPIQNNVSALQPDLKELSGYLTGLVNAGIITADEARAEIRYTALNVPETTDIRVPANIAGSAVNPNEGGAPKKE